MSGKFLSGVKKMAEKQKENLKLILEEHGSIYSALRVRRSARRARRRLAFVDDAARLVCRMRESATSIGVRAPPAAVALAPPGHEQKQARV